MSNIGCKMEVLIILGLLVAFTVANNAKNAQYWRPCGSDRKLSIPADVTVSVTSQEECATFCMQDEQCTAFNYQIALFACDMFHSEILPFCIDPILLIEIGSEYFEKRNSNVERGTPDVVSIMFL